MNILSKDRNTSTDSLMIQAGNMTVRKSSHICSRSFNCLRMRKHRKAFFRCPSVGYVRPYACLSQHTFKATLIFGFCQPFHDLSLYRQIRLQNVHLRHEFLLSIGRLFFLFILTNGVSVDIMERINILLYYILA